MNIPDTTQMGTSDIAALQQAIMRAMNNRLKSGVFPFFGKWMSLQEITESVKVSRRKARLNVLELLILFAFITSVSAVMILLVISLCY